MSKFVPTAMLPRLDPGDAAWLLVLIENAVPVAPPGHPMNWEGKGRRYAYELLAKAAGAHLHLCGFNSCPLAQGHEGEHVGQSESAA